MARGIMADKGASPSAEDDIQTKASNSNPIESSNHSTDKVVQCSCTKISTMQLFYEMKQKFPTVPDNVVCECVGQNCHNRSACIDCLEDYPNSTKVYPEALRNQPMKKKTQNNQQSQTINACDKSNQSNLCDEIKENVSFNENITANVQMTVSQQSNTLNLTNLNCCTRPINRRPTRVAPPPPTTATIPNPKSQPLNLSVNVIVSPVTTPSNSQYSHSHCSFTLHQPNSRIDNATMHPTNTQPSNRLHVSTDNNSEVNNGASLKYTSSTYDNEIGCQSRFEITVAGTHSNDQDNPMALENGLPRVVASSEFLEETETVHHQILSKHKLVLELEKDQKRLERMQRELLAIKAPLPEGGLEALNNEIEKLRNDCKIMAQHVEEAGPSYALGETNEAFYRNIYTGQQLPLHQRPPLRPHRPAPVPDFRLIQNCSTSNPGNAIGANQTTTQPSCNPVMNETNEETGWTCDLCTFQNKYTQQTCEACAKPFLSAGNQMGFYVQSPMISTPLPIRVPLPSSTYPLTHYMPMHSLPYSYNNAHNHNNNNNNNINTTYLYYQPTSMPPQFYPGAPAIPGTDQQSMHSRF